MARETLTAPRYALARWNVCDDSLAERLSDVRPYRCSPARLADLAHVMTRRDPDPCQGWCVVWRTPEGWRYARR